MLDEITPLLITLDEEPNVERSLDALEWARDIVVVDSGSTDGTLDLLEERPQVRVLHREFDSFARQCSHGVEHGGIRTEWVLSLDADHVLTPELTEELRCLSPDQTTSGFEAAFTYCIHGRALRGSLYPPRIVLFRRGRGSYRDDGHGHRIEVDGRVERLAARILHDDRKSLTRWLAGQDRYAREEARKLLGSGRSRLPLQDRIRKLVVVAPFAAFCYCLFVKRGLLDGRAGWHYAFQRMIAESLLSLRLLERKLSRSRVEA